MPGTTSARGAAAFVRGMGDVVSAARAWSSHTRALSWGVVPAVLAAIVVAVVIVAAIVAAPTVGQWGADQVTSASGWNTLFAWFIGIAAVVATGLISIKLYVSIALIIGQPFYERISAAVDDLNPADAAAEEAWWVTTTRGVGDAVRLLAWTVPVAFVGFVLGFVPVVGPVAAFTLSALVGGWLLAVELTAYPSARRGVVTLKQRRALLSRGRARAWGFGTGIYLLMLIPGAALVVLPMATVGATHLISRLDRVEPTLPAGK